MLTIKKVRRRLHGDTVSHSMHHTHTPYSHTHALSSGMVYNVTPYMDYHPGGEEELMKAAGIDGTDLFDQVCVVCSV